MYSVTHSVTQSPSLFDAPETEAKRFASELLLELKLSLLFTDNLSLAAFLVLSSAVLAERAGHTMNNLSPLMSVFHIHY